MTIGIAVIGAGMAGRAHAAAYRTAPTLYQSTLPPLRYVSIGDVSPEFGSLAARRFGYERSDTSWQAIAENPDIHVVSVVVANSLHREMVEGLLAAGKHVLCEKPLSDTLEDARAMADAARSADTVARIGFTFRRAPGVAALRELVTSGALGRVLHVDARYWCDYASDPKGPISWRYQGSPRVPALWPTSAAMPPTWPSSCAATSQEVSGGRFATAITERPVPLGAVIGHGQAAVSDTYEAVENDDYAGFSARFANGVGVVQVSRVAAGHPNGLALEVFGDQGAAKWEQERPAEFQLMLNEGPQGHQGVPPRHHRPRPPVRGRRAADGRTRGRPRTERRFRLPGARLPRGGRRASTRPIAAPLRVVRRGRAQHGGARRRRRVSRSRRSLGEGAQAS